MADLAKLFGKKDSNDKPANVESNGAAESKPVSPTAPAANTTTPQPANPFARAGSSGASGSQEQPGGGTPSSGNAPSGSGQPKSGLENVFASGGARNPSGDSKPVDAAPLTSLESLDSSEDEGTAPRGQSVTYFADETPATAPTRTLPEGLSKDALGFIDSLDSIYNIIHDAELLGGVIKNIMLELKNNAEYAKLLAPEDVRVMVRGMRESMGLARVKKQEAKAKRSGGGTRKSKAVDIDMLADLDSLGID